MDRAVLVARDDNRLQADPARYIVAGLGNFAFMRDVYPVAIPYLRELFLEHGRVVVNTPAHAIVLDQLLVVGLHRRHRRRHPGHPYPFRSYGFRSLSSRAGSRNGVRSSWRAQA